METPLWLEVVIQAGKFLSIRPLATVADPGNMSAPPGGVCRMLIPTKGMPLVGGPAKPLAQQGLCRMQSLHVRLKQKLHSSVMQDSLHLSHTRLSGAESWMCCAEGLSVNGGLPKSKMRRGDWIAPRLFMQAIAFPPEGLSSIL